jgi:tetratricopeptide (TPR) repeat protein
MNSHPQQCEAAILAGAWDTLFAEASAWVVEHTDAGPGDPRAHFGQNVVYLLRGQFADAWKAHAACLEAEADFATVKAWVEDLLARHQDNGHAQLVTGLFLAQSGQSEQSVQCYKDAARLNPQSAYPHYFLAQIHVRASHLEMAIKEYKEAVRLDPAYVPARTNLGVAYQEQGRLEMAIKEYREVISCVRATRSPMRILAVPWPSKARWNRRCSPTRMRLS